MEKGVNDEVDDENEENDDEKEEKEKQIMKATQLVKVKQ